MRFQVAGIVLALLVSTSTGQLWKGQRHRRQAPVYGNSSSTATVTSISTPILPPSTSSTLSQPITSGPLESSSPSPFSTSTGSSSSNTSLPPYSSAQSPSSVLSTSSSTSSTSASSAVPYGYQQPSTANASSASLFSYSPQTTSSSTIIIVSAISTSTTILSAYSSPSSNSSSESATPASSAPVVYSETSFPYRPSGYKGPTPVGPGSASIPAPSSNSSGPGYASSTTSGPSSTITSNATCSGATLNVLGASLDWWFTETYTYAVSTFSFSYDRNLSTSVWTLVPATTTFDVASAVAQPTCPLELTSWVYTNQTYTYYIQQCISTPAPVAASTTVVAETAFITPNATTGVGQIPDLATTPAPAAITIPSGGGNFSAGTPFVYFSAYEVMSKYSTTFGNGSAGCAETTQIYNMSSPFSFEYTGANVDGELLVGADVTGDVNPAFLGIVGLSTAVAGSWVAAPTVAVVVEEVLAAAQVVPAAASFTIAPSVLETITPTVPTFLSQIPASDNGQDLLTKTPGLSDQVESTQSFLLLPTQATTSAPANTPNQAGAAPTTRRPISGFLIFIAQIQGTQTTLILPTPTDVPVITTDIGGQEITATALGDTQGTGAAGGGAAQNGGGSSAGLTVLPFVGSSDGSQVTIAVQVPSTQTVVTAQFAGGTITATAETGGQNTPAAPAPGLGNLVSAVVSAVQPTNALQVLSEAEDAAGSNPTAVAIAAGIGVTPAGGNSGSNSGVQANAGIGANSGSGSQPAAPVITVGGQTITANAATQFVLGPSATLTPGGQVVVSGTTVSLANGATAVVINGQTSAVSVAANTPGAAANIPLLTIGSQTFTANAATQFSLGPSATLTPGGVVVVSGTTISLANGASAVVVDGVTSSLSPAAITPAPAVTLGGTVYAPNAGSTYDIGGSILTPGGVITVSGTTISLGPSGSAIVVNGKTTTLSAGAAAAGTPTANIAYPTITAPAVLTVNGQAFAANGGTSYVISGKTLTPGGSVVITESNGVVETISLNAAANELVSVVSGTSMTSLIGAVGAMSTGAPALTINGQIYTATAYDSGSGPTYIISGQTLTRGGEITISGPSGLETISLESAGTAIVEIKNGQTTTSTIAGAYGVMPTAAPILTIGGETFTAINNGATYVINGETLTPGEMETVTIGGHTYVISLAPQATLLMIEVEGANGQIISTSMETLFPAQMTKGTVTNMVSAGAAKTAASVTGGASSTGGSGPNAGLQGAGSLVTVQVTGVSIALASLILAIWL